MSEHASATHATPVDFERERLGLLRRSLDPITIRRLGQLDIARDWHCLEVGAGDGSMARWLATDAVPDGKVVATDIDTRLLDEQPVANIEVRRHNILEDEVEQGGYDLVHCRALAMHLSDPNLGLEKMASAVRPGGWLFVEELDCISFRSVDPDYPGAKEFDANWQTIMESLRTWRVMDMFLGRRIRGMIERLSFVDVGNEGTSNIERGGEPGARFLRMNLEFLGPLVSAGLLTQENLESLRRLCDDPSFMFVGGTCFGVWGRQHHQPPVS